MKSHVTETILPASGAAVSRCRTGMEGQGCRVTHFDISQPMIEKAKELAEREGLMGGDREIDEYERGGAPWCITNCL